MRYCPSGFAKQETFGQTLLWNSSVARKTKGCTKAFTAVTLQIMEAVGMKKAGPQLGRLTTALLAWQLGRPQATEDEARVWLQQQPVES